MTSQQSAWAAAGWLGVEGEMRPSVGLARLHQLDAIFAIFGAPDHDKSSFTRPGMF
jgi:hypothetical protein